MKNKGFTLIELLATITILSIILLIVFASVTSVMKNSKKSLHDTQIKQIEKAAEYYNNEEGLNNYDTCVSVNQLIEKGYIKEDKIMDPKSGKEITGSVKIRYNGRKYSYEYREKGCQICKATEGVVSTELGTKYSCEVKDNTNYNFYVLSTNEDDTVNLIMDRNICEDGKAATEQNTCLVSWHAGEDNNNYGPDTAMTNLYQATKSWTNVPDMIMAYEDENNKGTDYGYTSITTNGTTKVTTITGKQNKTSTNQTFGNTTEPLKARLPREDEVFKEEQDSNYCNYNSASCPTWLVENLDLNSVFSWCSTCQTKYADTQKTANIYGYWLLSSIPGVTDFARVVDCNGVVYSYNTSHASHNGLRAVITVSKSDLS